MESEGRHANMVDNPYATSLSELRNLSHYRFGNSRFCHLFRHSPKSFLKMLSNFGLRGGVVTNNCQFQSPLNLVITAVLNLGTPPAISI